MLIILGLLQYLFFSTKISKVRYGMGGWTERKDGERVKEGNKL